MRDQRLFPFAALLLFALGMPNATAQTGAPRPVALSGTDGPLGPGLGAGVFFAEFATTSESGSTPAISRVGRSVFAARLVGTGVDATNDTGIWVERGGQLVMLARKGAHAPGTGAGVTFSAFARQPLISSSGKTALLAELAGPGVDFSNDEGLWSEGSGSLGVLIREGTTPVPGSPGDQFGNPFQPANPNSKLWLGLPAINADGRVLVSAFLTATPLTAGEYTDRSGALEELVRMGDPVPGLAPRTFASLVGYPGFSDAGKVAFHAITSTPFPQFQGFWSDRSGPIASVAITGDPAAGTSSIFASFGFVPGFNQSNQIAFKAGANDGSVGIWSEGLFGVIQPIAFEGSIAPGTTDTFFLFEDPVLSDGGKTAFTGTVNILSANRGVWSNRSGQLDLVARSGAQVPGVPGATFKDFFALALNASGEVAFFTTTSTGKALCRQDTSGVLTTVFSEFTTLDVLGDGTDIRLITDVVVPMPIYAGEPSASATGDGRRIAFSDGGDIVSRLKFSDGSEGIFSTAPLPAFKDLGGGLAGLHGIPSLTGTGTLIGGDLASISLTGALENSTTGLVFGLSAVNVPFLGGVLVPSPDAVVFFPTGATGEVQVSTTWPTGTSPGTMTYYQFWTVDPAAPAGVSASNALIGTTP